MAIFLKFRNLGLKKGRANYGMTLEISFLLPFLSYNLKASLNSFFISSSSSSFMNLVANKTNSLNSSSPEPVHCYDIL